MIYFGGVFKVPLGRPEGPMQGEVLGEGHRSPFPPAKGLQSAVSSSSEVGAKPRPKLI